MQILFFFLIRLYWCIQVLSIYSSSIQRAFGPFMISCSWCWVIYMDIWTMQNFVLQLVFGFQKQHKNPLIYSVHKSQAARLPSADLVAHKGFSKYIHIGIYLLIISLVYYTPIFHHFEFFFTVDVFGKSRNKTIILTTLVYIMCCVTSTRACVQYVNLCMVFKRNYLLFCYQCSIL